jgi:thiol:disulfide interchange protein DsbD
MLRNPLHRLALLLAGLSLWLPTARAVDPSDLLPVDEAYVLSAQATAPDAIAIRFTIAPGYYLYRHRFGAQLLDAGASAGALRIPAGDKHHDQFFGDVETYRKDVTLVLPAIVVNGARQVQLKVKYQGCADIGVCYPPQTRTLTVALPAGAAAGAGSRPPRASSMRATAA